MKGDPSVRLGLHERLVGVVVVAAALCLLLPGPADAAEFRKGKFEANWDNTLSYGIRYRVEDPDQAIVGEANRGTAYGVNADTGTLNYDKGIASSVGQLTSEFEFRYKAFGGFFRGTAFYDYENAQGDRLFTPLTPQAERRVADNAEMLDAYLRFNFDLGRVPVELRLGEQVISWGESTFIPNSINTINPIDLTKFRTPGAELRQALLPEGTFWGSLGTSANTSLDFYYQFDWEPVRIDPPGTYFSANDFVGEGGKRVMLGFGGAREGDFLGVNRGTNQDADSQGQYGLSFRWYVPALNDTELSFYFINYHSKVPLISAQTGSPAGLGAAGLISLGGTGLNVAGVTGTSYQTSCFTTGCDALGAVTAGVFSGALDPTNPTPMSVDQASAIAATTVVASDALINGVGSAIATGVALGLTQPQAARIANGSAALGSPDVSIGLSISSSATDAYAKTANYHIVYPEDIRLYGFGFNTTVGTLALQGEISHRKDKPLQVDDIEVLFGALSPINPLLDGQLGLFGPGREVVGYIERDVSQVQCTLTNLFGPTWGADNAVLVGEVGYHYVHDMPNKDTLRLNGPGTFISGNAGLAATAIPNFAPLTIPLVHQPTAPGEIEAAERFADDSSWGYRIVGRLDYNNAIGPMSLLPRFSWAHDVSGISPGPGGPFLEDRKAVTVGLDATYLNSWSGGINYTRFYGAGRYNLLNDRDFVGFEVKYSF